MGLHFSLYFKKIASWGRARQSPGGVKPAHPHKTVLHHFFNRERETKEKKSGLGPCSTFNGVKLGSEEERWLDCGYKTMKTLKLGVGGFTLKV